MVRDKSDAVPDAVAAHSPPDTIADAFISKDFDPNAHETCDPSRRPWVWRGASDDLKPTTPIEIERFKGPLFISHGEEDSVWTVDGTKRLEERLKAAGRSPEVHYLPNEDHGFSATTENAQHERLVDFFRRSMKLSDLEQANSKS